MHSFEEARESFKTHRAKVAVLGLGYAGLPLACSFAESGFEVVALDIDEQKVQQLRKGDSYIPHIDSEWIRRLVVGGKLNASSDFGELASCSAAIICVPTPLTDGRDPDLRHVIDTTRAIRDHIHRGMLVVLESTTYPGTTDEVVLPILAESGLLVGQDFFLAFSPEREDPANKSFSTRTIPKLVGGVTHNCLEVAAAAYGEVVERVVPVSSARVAEAAKLLENIYRCVNIAMINELKLLFELMGIDIWEVVKAASTKPFGFTPFYPGPGLGGHCIPIDPFYLSWKARQYDFQTRFIELAGEINRSIPSHVVDRINDGLNLRGKALKGANVLLIGVAYKPNVDDVRESPALAIIRLLDSKLARVFYHDPLVPRLRSRHLKRVLSSCELTAEMLHTADATVIVTDHRSIDYKIIMRNSNLIIDTRNATAALREGADNVLLA
jgi:UDP-N-acetyl-D-glucosamine dehydrogenase